MTDTDCYEMDYPVENLAIGYSPDPASPYKWQNNLYKHVLKGGPAGGGFSTVKDLHRFALALLAGQARIQEPRDLMWTDFKGANYGYGFTVVQSPGGKAVGHSGGFPGINSQLDIYVDSGYVVAAMCNYDSGASALANKIGGILARVKARLRRFKMSKMIRWIVIIVAILALWVSLALGQEAKAPTLDAAKKQAIVDEIAALFNKNYIFAETAKKVEEALRAKLKAGDFDKLSAAPDFARAVAATILDVSKDRHTGFALQSGLGRGHPAPRGPERGGGAEGPRAAAPRGPAGQLRLPQGRAPAREHRLHRLPASSQSPAEAGPTAVAAMNFLAYCDAVIVDLRQNGGGDPAQIQLISSYFFEEPVHLNDLYARAADRTENYWTLPYVPGAKAAKADLYVLTSARTFSGAEEFSYNLQNLKRATIIGETTGGGAHPTNAMIVQRDFILRVPFARAINPVSKTNWEGTGVKPDIACPGRGSLRQGLRPGRREARRQGDRPADQGRVRVDPRRREGQGEPAAGRRKDLEDLRRRLRRAQGHVRERRPLLSADRAEIPAHPHDRDPLRPGRPRLLPDRVRRSRTGRRSSSSGSTTTATAMPRPGRNSSR